jgi:hypothetical protein
MSERGHRMSRQERLERGYRRVLACYPKSFRRDTEGEIVAVLLATAADGQQRVRLAEAADLICGALRMRRRPAGRPPRAVRGAVRLMCIGAVAELAAAISQGRDAARFAFSSFFALITLVMLITLAQRAAAYAPADTIAFAATWPVALVTMVLIFTPQSNRYYQQAAQPAVIT